RQPAVEAGDQRLVERVAPRGAVQGERQHAGIEALEQRVVHAHPIAQTFLGARPLLARYARCAPTPARLRRAPQTPSASSSALALGLPLSGPPVQVRPLSTLTGCPSARKMPRRGGVPCPLR